MEEWTCVTPRFALLLLAGQAADKPTFEVASIKRNLSIERIAYRQGSQLFPSQLVGGPEWTTAVVRD